jgi:hypothetical protein
MPPLTLKVMHMRNLHKSHQLIAVSSLKHTVWYPAASESALHVAEAVEMVLSCTELCRGTHAGN